MMALTSGSLLIAATVKTTKEKVVIYGTSEGSRYLLTVNVGHQFARHSDISLRFSHFLWNPQDVDVWLGRDG